jgi:putative ABC transport system permease protein
MIAYNTKLAIKSLKDRPSLTILMVAAISVGLALFMITTTMSHQTEKIPLPHKSEDLYLVQLDNREVEADEIKLQARMVDLSYQDTINLHSMQTSAKQQTYVWNSNGILNVEAQETEPLRASMAATTSEFFSMFDAPFLYGRAWTTDADVYGHGVIVLTKETNEYLFAGANSVGKQVRLGTIDMTVIGVMDNWFLSRKFYDRSYRRANPDQAFIPSSFGFNNELPRNAGFDCWSTVSNPNQFRDSNLGELKASECAWLTFWAEISGDENVQDYQSTVNQYVAGQKEYGRFPREINNFYTNINQQLAYINGRTSMQGILNIIAMMFFAVCLINAVSILMAKFMGRTKEVSLRRALGAKKKTIFQQHVIEVLMIGFIGGFIGVILAHFGLQGMLNISLYASDYMVLAKDLQPYHQMDWQMVGMAFLVALGSTMLVGLYPIWRICNVSPASQLKAQ